MCCNISVLLRRRIDTCGLSVSYLSHLRFVPCCHMCCNPLSLAFFFCKRNFFQPKIVKCFSNKKNCVCMCVCGIQNKNLTGKKKKEPNWRRSISSRTSTPSISRAVISACASACAALIFFHFLNFFYAVISACASACAALRGISERV